MFRRARSSDMVSHDNSASTHYAQNVNTFEAQTLLTLGSYLGLRDKKTQLYWGVVTFVHFFPRFSGLYVIFS